jgi:hypothetical protein
MHFRMFLGVVCMLLAATQGTAQQIGEYPSKTATMDRGAYVCKSKEALLLTLRLFDHSIEYGGMQYIPPPRSCHVVLSEVEVTLSFVEVFVGKHFTADILEVEFNSDNARAGERFFVQGEEAMLSASI